MDTFFIISTSLAVLMAVYPCTARSQWSVGPLQWSNATDLGIAQPSVEDIDASTGGVFDGNKSACVMDLSHALSLQLGKQMPMMATYRVKSIRVGLINSLTGDNNDMGGQFHGTIATWQPNRHIIKAAKLHDAARKAIEKQQFDGDGLLMPTHHKYKGMRFGFYRADDVDHPTGLVTPDGTSHGLSLYEMKERYDLAYPKQARDNQLWQSAAGNVSKIQWSASMDLLGSDMRRITGDWNAPSGSSLEVCGGLLAIIVEGSGLPEIDVDDDFYLEVTVDVEGWKEW